MKNTMVGEPEGTVECIDFNWNYEEPIYREIDMRSWLGLYTRLLKTNPVLLKTCIFLLVCTLYLLAIQINIFFILIILVIVESIEFVENKFNEIHSKQGDKQ